MTQNEAIIKAGELIAQRSGAGAENFCTLTGIGPDGWPVSTTITAARSEGIRWLACCTGKGAPSALRFLANPKASFCLNGPDYHIGLVGDVEVCTDIETKRKMWYLGLSNHFSGPEDENLAVLCFTTRRYSLFVGWEVFKGEIDS